jgi:hypothetical protein
MLLTSSLSIETIRAYSRKFKTFPPGARLDAPASPSSLPYPSRKWTLGRILYSSRRSNASSNTLPSGEHRSSGAGRDSVDTASSHPAAPPPWTALRTVFDSAPEHLCDALYAHIVAYNYVSSLRECRPHPTPSSPPPPLRPSTSNSGFGRPRNDGGAAIPRKAAALLGLDGPEPQSRSSVDTHGTRSTSAETQPRREGALRELLVGLSRCIGRLIVTLKEGRTDVVASGGEDGEAGAANVDVDMFLAKALCEVVRCSEDR